MKTAIDLTLKLLVAMLALFIGLALVSASYIEPMRHPGLELNDQAVWPSNPIHIDVSRQTYERLPSPSDPFPLKFLADRQFKVLDNGSFALGSSSYRLSGVVPIARNLVCSNETGHKYACGLNAFKALDNAMRKRFVECRIVIKTPQSAEVIVACQVEGQDLTRLVNEAVLNERVW